MQINLFAWLVKTVSLRLVSKGDINMVVKKSIFLTASPPVLPGSTTVGIPQKRKLEVRCFRRKKEREKGR